ncbi:MAG: aspartate carbamoyltransferase catalytic subunit [Alphaproteobacteria bacterium]|nr:aspartate carbamoyltransferase catalytic subunit [Alphaproteobacteria bacterium]
MRHLLGIDELSHDDIQDFLDRAQYYVDALASGKWDRAKLKHKIVLSLFFEPSTRTLTSFDMAAKRLGADVVNWNPETSSLNSKGESFSDTIETLNAMGPDAIIIRHREYGAPNFVAKRVDCPVINAGDSWREHPSQALLDALTIQQNFDKIEGLTITIVGDIAHSRVASSNLQLLTKMGAKVRIVAPESLMPQKLPADGIEAFTVLEDGIKDSDIIYTIRLQKERMDNGLIESNEAYFNHFGLTHERVNKVAPKAMIMEAGPLVRGMQMSDELADDPTRNLMKKQVTNGIPTRMAILDMLVGG